MDQGRWPSHAEHPNEGVPTRDFSGAHGNATGAFQGKSALGKTYQDLNPSSTQRQLCCLEQKIGLVFPFVGQDKIIAASHGCLLSTLRML